jgi:hypothetical protein
MLKKVQILFVSLIAALIVNYLGSWWQTARFGSSEYLVLFFFKLSDWQLRQIGVPIVFLAPIVAFFSFLSVPFLIKKSARLHSFQVFIWILLSCMLLPYISAYPLDDYFSLTTFKSSMVINIIFGAVTYGITIALCLLVIFLSRLQFKLTSKNSQDFS